MTPRTLATASILAVGTELTIGTTRDTNSGDLARDLAAIGVTVERLVALPDDLGAVTEAIRDGLARADLVIITGGLGPTPDDLTREAIAAACGETPEVDPALEAWLVGLFARRGIPMPAINRKQAWRIPSASTIENERGTAPGWWVDRPDGRLIVALPGPPSEMRPMWQTVHAPAPRARRWRGSRLGDPPPDRHRRVRPGRPRGRGTPATRQPADGDLRPGRRGRPAHQRDRRRRASLPPTSSPRPRPRSHRSSRPYCFARGDETWIDALGARLAGRRLAVVEIGTAGQLAALLAPAPWFTFGEILAPGSPLASAHHGLEPYATRVREIASAEVGIAVRARERAGDTSVTVATDIEGRIARVTRTAFLAGDLGRRRAALVAAAELWRRLGDEATPE